MGAFQFEVDKGISIPHGDNKKHKYPFAIMEVGDSFLIPANDAAEAEKIYRRMGAYTSQKRLMGLKLKCKKVEGGVRIWRTA
jgi:hypothetical protein